MKDIKHDLYFLAWLRNFLIRFPLRGTEIRCLNMEYWSSAISADVGIVYIIILGKFQFSRLVSPSLRFPIHRLYVGSLYSLGQGGSLSIILFFSAGITPVLFILNLFPLSFLFPSPPLMCCTFCTVVFFVGVFG